MTNNTQPARTTSPGPTQKMLPHSRPQVQQDVIATTLLVGEDLEMVRRVTKPGVAMFCAHAFPSMPLEIGSVLQLLLAPELHQPEWAMPCAAPCGQQPDPQSLRTDVLGPIVAINKQDEVEVVFVVDNWTRGAEIKRAYVRIPAIPGFTTCSDLWGTFAAELPRRLRLLEQRPPMSKTDRHEARAIFSAEAPLQWLEFAVMSRRREKARRRQRGGPPGAEGRIEGL
ncbi:hypothetical protein C2E23DRAFT_904688 [Lenzites betulinus]|nr:hypothetical protein C2E23DRAFT_904688 [Lenzites betulinus]